MKTTKNPRFRHITDAVLKDLEKKIVIISGPRQCGKTTLAKNLTNSFQYFNYDISEDRSIFLKKTWNRDVDLIIFDELHKMPKWKSWLKGIYDSDEKNPNILVTGSAKLDTFKKVGESLAGRHFYFRLHPFDIKELSQTKINLSPDTIMERLMNVSGYPEPFLTNDMREYKRWRQSHIDLILRQDLIDIQVIRDIRTMELLIELLRSKVGSPLSINSLANDLQKDHKTIQRWLDLLEEVYIIFKISSYSKDIARSVKKEPKYYFYDTAYVNGDESIKLENLVACSLLKESHYQQDVHGKSYTLNFLKVKGGREIDFLLKSNDVENKSIMIEVKLSDDEPAPNFKLFGDQVKNVEMIQLVKNLKRDKSNAYGVKIKKASEWLAEIKLD
jgi:hypothetical protein